MPARVLFACLALSAIVTTPAVAQFRDSGSKGPKLGDSLVQRWQAGLIVRADSGPCRGLVGTAPVPADWPEQKVRILEEDFSPTARVSYQTVEGTVKQMIVQVPYLPAGEECRAVVTVEVERWSQLPPDSPDIYVLPEKKRIPRDVRPYLGPSPGIENTSSKIRSLARQFRGEDQTAWQKVKAICDWVGENVQQKEGCQGGAVAVLRAGAGDHEDLASLFIALCRASGIPARMVWVEKYCYPEFYLEDEEGNGYWFPCQVAGNADFGAMPDHRPIIEKGDNFPSPTDRRERKRFLSETLKVSGAKPSKEFIRRAVPH